MLTNAQISSGLESILREVAIPPAPTRRIMSLAASAAPPQRLVGGGRRLAFATAAVAVAGILALPAIAPAFVWSIEEEGRRALAALPGLPASVRAELEPREEPLAVAQSQMPFTIVPPVGLPSDVVSTTIFVSHPGLYHGGTRSWSVREAEVSFAYRRADGRRFIIAVGPYDPRAKARHRYVYDVDGPHLVRHQVFVWRNGKQLASAIEGGISAEEIVAIRTAMGGIALPTDATSRPVFGRGPLRLIPEIK